MKKLLLVVMSVMFLTIPVQAEVGDEGWAEFAAGVAIAVTPEPQVQFALEPRVFFNRLGIGGFVGLSGGAELDTNNIQIGATGHLYLWGGTVNIWKLKIQKLHILALGKILSERGGTQLSFANNEKGIELRPDFIVGNKIMAYIQVTHQQIEGAKDRLSGQFGAVFVF